MSKPTEAVYRKAVNVGMIVTFLICHLEFFSFSGNYFELHQEVLLRASDNPLVLLSPLTLPSFIGLIMLLCTLLQKLPGRGITIAGMMLLSPPVILSLIGSVADTDGKMFASLIPFILCCVVFIRSARRPATAIES